MKNAATELTMTYEEVILVLGGVFAIHPVADATMCELANALERIYRRAAGRARVTRRSAREPHPALQRLLRIVRGEVA